MNNGAEKVKALLWSALFLAIPIGMQFVLGFSYMIQAIISSIQTGVTVQMNDMANMSPGMEVFSNSISLMEEGWMLILLSLMTDGMMLACFGLWYYFREKKFGFKPDYSKGLSANNIGCLIGIGIFSQFAINIVIVMIHIIMPSAFERYSEISGLFDMSTAPAWLMILAVCIVGPIAEEVMFRGMIYGCIRRSFGMWPAAIISAVLFGVYHMNLVQGIYAAVLGVVLALVYEKTQTIYGSIIFHVVFNTSSYVVSWIEEAVAGSGSRFIETSYIFLGLISIAIVWILVNRIEYRVDVAPKSVSETSENMVGIDSDGINSL
ncbi:MAG: CPBP family intramembrane metalloprotease [Eubacterium sp.]|nr:CPBP family intramembrane metalloprotease [Eubacterium sp.]